MSEPDAVTERVQKIVRDEVRLATLGVRPVVRCRGCGDEVETDRAYSGRDPETGQRVYYCGPCNAEEEPGG